ncbi:MAG: hypothetical protein ACR2IF_00450 [Terriglobales bacterium]
MANKCESPFESIESARDFVELLSDTVSEAKRDINVDVEKALDSGAPRRLQALRLAAYSLERLEVHLNKSRRILNDLRSLRRLLLAQRAAPSASKAPAPVKVTAPETSVTFVTGKPLPPVYALSTAATAARPRVKPAGSAAA